MITATQNGSLYEIRFPYDPTLVELVKTVPGRWYHPEGKYWSVPLEKLGFFQSRLANTPYYPQLRIISQEDIAENATIDFTEEAEIPDIDISGIELYVKDGYSLYNHQIDTLKFEIDRKRKGRKFGFILADQPGLGKTLQIINLALYNKNHEHAKHCLIVACINSAKHNWVSDIAKHTNGEYEGYLLGSRLNRKGEVKPDQTGEDKYLDLKTGFKYGNEDAGPLPYFLIVNIEAFRYKDKKLKKHKNAFTWEVINQIKEGNISMIALDEVHRNASPTCDQGKQILEVKKQIQGDIDIEWIPMTGTPIVNNPLDVFLPLKLVNGHSKDSFYEWSREYCVYGGYGGHEIISYKNIPKLKSLLQPNMLRRKREDVLDLPPKVEMIEYVENTAHQNKLYGKILLEMSKDKEKIRQSLNPMTAFLRLRQINGAPEIVDPTIQIDGKYLSKNAKVKRALELIEEIIANNEKVVVFSNWVETLKAIYKILEMKKIKTCVYTGTMKQEVREQHKEVFMNNPEYHVILGTIGALGTSHTLTAATNEIFLDEPWSPAVKDQAMDRIYRIGTTQSVTIYTLLSQGTVDDKVHDLLFKKQGSSDLIVDNMNDVLKTHPEMLDWLLT